VPTTLDPGDSSSRMLLCNFFSLPLTSRIAAVWVFRFSCEGTAEIVARSLTATPPRYSTIKELDRRVRELSFPPNVLEAIRGGPGADPLSLPLPVSMIVFLLSTTQDVSKLSSLSGQKFFWLSGNFFQSPCFSIATTLSRHLSKTPMTR
jgi:hypothetical protein